MWRLSNMLEKPNVSSDKLLTNCDKGVKMSGLYKLWLLWWHICIVMSNKTRDQRWHQLWCHHQWWQLWCHHPSVMTSQFCDKSKKEQRRSVLSHHLVGCFALLFSFMITFLNFLSEKCQNIIVQVGFNALIVCYGTRSCFLHAPTGKLDLILWWSAGLKAFVLWSIHRFLMELKSGFQNVDLCSLLISRWFQLNIFHVTVTLVRVYDGQPIYLFILNK